MQGFWDVLSKISIISGVITFVFFVVKFIFFGKRKLLGHKNMQISKNWTYSAFCGNGEGENNKAFSFTQKNLKTWKLLNVISKFFFAFGVILPGNTLITSFGIILGAQIGNQFGGKLIAELLVLLFGILGFGLFILDLFDNPLFAPVFKVNYSTN